MFVEQRRLSQKFIFLLNIYLCGVIELQQEIYFNLTRNKTAYFPCMSIIENRNISFSLTINTVSYQPVLQSEFMKKANISIVMCFYIYSDNSHSDHYSLSYYPNI